MQSESSPKSTLEGANALIAHLRNHPEDALRSPSELAARFSLPDTFVENVLRGARPPDRTQRQTFRFSFRFVQRAIQSIVAAFDRVTARPVAFVVVTTLIAIGLFFVVRFSMPLMPLAGDETRGIAIGATVVALFLSTATLQLLCYFHRGMSRYAIQGALAVWMIMSSTMVIANYFDNVGEDGLERLLAALVLVVVTFIMCGLYACAGCLASVLGGYLRVKRRELQQERMSRQELLERYFELQARLKEEQGSASQEPSWFEALKFVHALRRNTIAYAVAISIVVGLLSVAIAHFGRIGPDLSGQSATPMQIFMLLGQGLLGLLSFAMHIAYGFFVERVPRAIALGLSTSLAGWLVNFVPVGPFGPTYATQQSTLTTTAVVSFVMVALCVIGALGAQVQQRARQDQNLRANDPASILAEMLRIQWQLSVEDTTVCIMVVDAAKSSEMKATADPLAVEYSFREYQQWLEEIGSEYRGRVHSTAGDGAVIAFSNCLDAYLASRRIQTDVDRFNREDNRLPLPFRLRIGLHVDEVAGELSQVQFAEVIDVAAHVEARSLVGGIAASEDVVNQLLQEDFTSSDEIVDGHRVYHAIHPRDG
jgi:class 3 adenylate cyclase